MEVREKGNARIIWTRDFIGIELREIYISLFLFLRLILRKGLRFSHSYPQDVVYARGRRKSIHLGGYDVPAISTSRRFIETPWEFYRGPLIDLSERLLPTADLSRPKERPYARKEESRRWLDHKLERFFAPRPWFTALPGANGNLSSSLYRANHLPLLKSSDLYP